MLTNCWRASFLSGRATGFIKTPPRPVAKVEDDGRRTTDDRRWTTTGDGRRTTDGRNHTKVKLVSIIHSITFCDTIVIINKNVFYSEYYVLKIVLIFQRISANKVVVRRPSSVVCRPSSKIYRPVAQVEDDGRRTIRLISGLDEGGLFIPCKQLEI